MDYQPIMNEVQIVENAVSPMFLEYVRYQVQESENWSAGSERDHTLVNVILNLH